MAGLARAESWLLLPLAAAYGVLAWRRGERRALLLVLPLAAPLLWLAHDWLLTGDPLYAVRVPGRYTDLVSGRQVVPPADWLALVARRYLADPLLLALAAVGAIWLARRRAWLWLVALGATGVGVLALLGLQAWQGTYISWRYFDPADLAVRLAAAFGAAALATWAAARLVRGRGAVAGAVLLVGVACWPLAPGDPVVSSTLDRDTRLSANAATAIGVLAPVAAEQGTVVTASGPQRVRVAVELGLPLERVRDLFLAGRAASLDQALAGSAAVFHDADGDRPTERFAPLSVTVPRRVGKVELVPSGPTPDRGCTSTGSRAGRLSGNGPRPVRVAGQAPGARLELATIGLTGRLLCRLSYPGMAAPPSSALTSPMTLRWVDAATVADCHATMHMLGVADRGVRNCPIRLPELRRGNPGQADQSRLRRQIEAFVQIEPHPQAGLVDLEEVPQPGAEERRSSEDHCWRS